MVRPLEILIIEDQCLGEVNNMVEGVLADQKINISYALTLDQAKEKLQERKYGLILLDNRMPEKVEDAKITKIWKDKQMGTIILTEVNTGALDYHGYKLIPDIQEQQPHALLIGTSNCDSDQYKGPRPEKYLSHKGDGKSLRKYLKLTH